MRSSKPERSKAREPSDTRVETVAERIAAASAALKSLQGLLSRQSRPTRTTIERLRAVLKAVTELQGTDQAIESLVDEAEKQIVRDHLELESDVRDAFATRGWKVDGQWPELYVERGIRVVATDAGTFQVGLDKAECEGSEDLALALEAQIQQLVPKGFRPNEFIEDLERAYDLAKVGTGATVTIFDLYRAHVIHQQTKRFWRDAKQSNFTALSQDQFRARLAAILEQRIDTAKDGRRLKVLPPLDPREGLFVYQPSEGRFGYVGRVEFTKEVR